MTGWILLRIVPCDRIMMPHRLLRKCWLWPKIGKKSVGAYTHESINRAPQNSVFMQKSV